jgi:hypothetical protein
VAITYENSVYFIVQFWAQVSQKARNSSAYWKKDTEESGVRSFVVGCQKLPYYRRASPRSNAYIKRKYFDISPSVAMKIDKIFPRNEEEAQKTENTIKRLDILQIYT